MINMIISGMVSAKVRRLQGSTGMEMAEWGQWQKKKASLKNSNHKKQHLALKIQINV